MTRREPLSLALLLALLLLAPLARPARADLTAFERAWQEAGGGEAKKLRALELLRADASSRAAKILLRLALSPTEPPAVSARALELLAALEGSAADRWITEQAQRAKHWQERAALVRAIGLRTSEAAVTPLLAALKDGHWQVRAAALPGLARHRQARVVAALIEALGALRPREPATPRLRAEIEDTLFLLTGERLQGAEAWAMWWRAVGPGWRAPEGDLALVEREEATVTRRPRLFRGVEALSRRVVFVIDVSSSMRVRTPSGIGEGDAQKGASRFALMVHELHQVIEQLPREVAFNIIAFSDEAQPWSRKLARADARHRKQALRFIAQLAPHGQTNVIGALEAAFADPQVDTIFFLSDGFPTAGRTIDFEKIHAEVARWNLTRGVRIHTIAFLSGDGKAQGVVEDKAMARAFMRELAQRHAGRLRVIE